ncbi:TetR/AcrR family transcriptional regulator [Halopseudomonas sp.]|uniref:TetR/AcrR family transcriptional regulator n=1 Tax=Halopseudomonas sp. TaxID=2901191 RepID=UPI0030035333
MTNKTPTPQPRPKPLKRPTQSRAKATVQAIFDTYVRIWQRDGWERITTRAIALEAGVAVGTLYDYFPSKQALHSGYVRHCIEALLQAIEQQAVAPDDLSWQQRLGCLVRLMCGAEGQVSWFHPEMLELEPLVAEQKHQRRAYDELLSAWRRVFDAASDLPHKPRDATLEAMHLAVWGGRRYAMLVQLDEAAMSRWAQQMERFCRQAVATDESSAG